MTVLEGSLQKETRQHSASLRESQLTGAWASHAFELFSVSRVDRSDLRVTLNVVFILFERTASAHFHTGLAVSAEAHLDQDSFNNTEQLLLHDRVVASLDVDLDKVQLVRPDNGLMINTRAGECL